MEIKNKSRLLRELAKSCNTPVEFIKGIMALQEQTTEDLAERAGISEQHFHVIMSSFRNNHTVGVGTVIKLAAGLDIDPYVLNWVISKHNMQAYFRRLESSQRI